MKRKAGIQGYMDLIYAYMCISIYFAQSSFLAMVEIAKVEICEKVWTRKDSKSLAKSSAENERKAEIQGYLGIRI